MPTVPTAPVLLADLTGRGFTVRVANGSLAVRPASALTAGDRAAIRQRRGELVAALEPVPAPTQTAGEPWDATVANRLMFDADTLVEQLGVDGRHPTIADAAARAVHAARTRDMEMLRFAVTEFAVTVRRVAHERGSAPGAGDFAPFRVRR